MDDATLDLAAKAARTRDVTTAAAPSPQLPWAMPTEDELYKAAASLPAIRFDEAREVIVNFLNMRNAPLMPKPVDPRVQMVREHISQWRMGNGETLTECATKLLEAIDEAKRC